MGGNPTSRVRTYNFMIRYWKGKTIVDMFKMQVQALQGKVCRHRSLQESWAVSSYLIGVVCTLDLWSCHESAADLAAKQLGLKHEPALPSERLDNDPNSRGCLAQISRDGCSWTIELTFPR